MSSRLINKLQNTVCVSAGAACHKSDVSYVLKAMNVPEEYQRGVLRISVGRFTTEDEIYKASEEIVKAINDV